MSKLWESLMQQLQQLLHPLALLELTVALMGAGLGFLVGLVAGRALDRWRLRWLAAPWWGQVAQVLTQIAPYVAALVVVEGMSALLQLHGVFKGVWFAIVVPVAWTVVAYRAAHSALVRRLPPQQATLLLRRWVLPGVLLALALYALGALSMIWEWMHQPVFSLAKRPVSLIHLLQAGGGFWVFHWLSVRLSAVVESALASREMVEPHVSHMAAIAVKVALWAAGIFVAVDVLGLNLSTFKVFAGAVGIGIGFGTQTIANNLISGLILMLDRTIRVGDVVSLGDYTGRVVHIGARATLIKTPQNQYRVVPNLQLMGMTLTNWTSRREPVRLDIPVHVAPVEDLGSVEEELLDIAIRHPSVLAEPKPQVLLTRIGSDVLCFELEVWSDDPTRLRDVQSELNHELYRRLRERGLALRG